jgi:hypothetical protein
VDHRNVDVYVDALVNVDVDGFWSIWLRSVPFEGPATLKSPALQEDIYSGMILTEFRLR